MWWNYGLELVEGCGESYQNFIYEKVGLKPMGYCEPWTVRDN